MKFGGKKFRICFALFFVIFFTLNSIQASAHQAYYLQITYDAGNYNFNSEILFDDGSSTSDLAHLETNYAYLKYIKDNMGNNCWQNPIADIWDPNPTDYSSALEEVRDSIRADFSEDVSSEQRTKNEKSMYYTFPPVHESSGYKGWIFTHGDESFDGIYGDLSANDEDYSLAQNINKYLIQDFNSLLTSIVKTQKEKPSPEKFLIFAIGLANTAWEVNRTGTNRSIIYDISQLSDVDGAYGRTTINLSVCDENTDDGDFLTANSKNLPNWYYIRAELICDAKAENGGAFTAEDYAMKNNINYYVSFMNKGYCKTGANKDYSFYKSYTESEVTDQIKQLTSRQDIYKNFCSGIIAGKKDTESARDFEFFGWKSVVLQGFELYGLGITSENSQELADQDSFWHSFTKGATWLYTQIMNLLGLDTMEEIFLNKGRIGNRTYMGLFPKAWLPVLNFVNIILQLIVWSLLAFSITRLLFKRSLATMNVGEKINLMEGMKDIIISAIVMGIWPLLFTMMGRFNYFIVDMFGSISPYSETFTLSLVSGANMFLLFGAYFILAMTVYFNYFYILRSLTLAFLYALAPIFIYTISLGGKGKSYFGAYIKEVTGHIYIQSIHALMISFFSYLDHAPTGSIGLNWLITKMVLIWAFVPITKFVRSAIFQMGDGVMGQMADQIQDTMGRKRKYGKDEAKAQADRMAGSGGGSGGSGGSSGGGSPAGGGREASISEAIARRRRSESDINSRDGTKNKDVYKATKKREAEMKKVAKMKPEQIDKWARNKMDGQSEKNILQKMSDSKAIKATKKIASNAIEGTTLGQGLKAFENLKNASRNDNGGISGKRFVSNTAKGLGKAAISGAGKSLKAGVMMGGAIQKSAIGNTQAADYYARRSGFESQVGKMQASAGFHEGISGNDFTTFNQEQSILDNPKNNSKKSQLQDFADSMRPYGRTKEGYTIYDFNTDKMSEMNEFLNNPENKKDQQTYNAANNRYSFVKNLDYYKDKPDDLRKLTGGYFNENNKFVDAEGRLNNSKDYIRMNADMNVAKVFDQAKENQKNNKGGNH